MSHQPAQLFAVVVSSVWSCLMFGWLAGWDTLPGSCAVLIVDTSCLLFMCFYFCFCLCLCFVRHCGAAELVSVLLDDHCDGLQCTSPPPWGALSVSPYKPFSPPSCRLLSSAVLLACCCVQSFSRCAKITENVTLMRESSRMVCTRVLMLRVSECRMISRDQ